MKLVCEKTVFGLTARQIKTETDFYLRTLEIVNDSQSSAEVVSLSFLLRGSGGAPICTVTYDAEQLEKRFREAVEELGFYRPGTWPRIVGEFPAPEESLSVSAALGAGQKALVMQEHFQIEAMEAVSFCTVTCVYRQGEAVATCQADVEIQEYRCKNEYDFPVKGSWMVTDIYKSVGSHRWCRNSEFAFDAGMLWDDLRLSHGEGVENEAFRCYGQPVYAPADGVVLEAQNGFPEHTISQREQMEPGDWDALERKYGPDARINGNYVTLLHQGGESSTLCHLIPGSVSVVPGQAVNRGQLLGRVGNSGNSSCPHLHFHLAEYPGTGAACLGRGLPCQFRNLTDVFGEPVEWIQEDGMLVFSR